VKPKIDAIPFLSAEDKAKIYQKNAEQVFTRFKASA
jgi:hypothetical protein